jgi:hypothetical protein
MDTEWAKAQNSLHHFYLQETTRILILMHECIMDYIYGHTIAWDKNYGKNLVVWLFLSASHKWNYGNARALY